MYVFWQQTFRQTNKQTNEHMDRTNTKSPRSVGDKVTARSIIACPVFVWGKCAIMCEAGGVVLRILFQYDNVKQQHSYWLTGTPAPIYLVLHF